MSRGEYAAVPLDIEADIDSFESNNQAIDGDNKRFVKLITVIVALLAIGWLIGICVIIGRQSLLQHSNNEYQEINKQSFNYYSYHNQSTNQPNPQSNNPPNNESLSPTTIQSVDQTVAHTASQTVNHTASQSIGQSIQPPSITSVHQSVIQPYSLRHSRKPFKYSGDKRMKPGSLAPRDFDFNGECGLNGYKCVVSFGLYGDKEKYVEGAIANAELMPIIYDGWTMRVYYDQSVPINAINRLRALNVELIESDRSINGTIAGMFWRFLVAAESSVDRFIIRDTDSRINERERAAVDEWLSSGYSIHLMRDHPNGHALPMNGGLWGGTKGVLSDIRQLIDEWAHETVGADQNLLNQKIFPRVIFDQLAHDAYTCQTYPNSIGFPTQRLSHWSHVGQVFENGKVNQEAIEQYVKGKQAPEKCRRNKEWLYG